MLEEEVAEVEVEVEGAARKTRATKTRGKRGSEETTTTAATTEEEKQLLRKRRLLLLLRGHQ